MKPDGEVNWPVALTLASVGALVALGAESMMDEGSISKAQKDRRRRHRQRRGNRNKDLDEDNWVYEDQTLGTFEVIDGEPNWGDYSRQELEEVLLETGAWSKSDFEVIDLKATVWDLMEHRHREEMG